MENNLFQITNHAELPRKWFDFHMTKDGTAEISIDGEIGGWGISAKSLTEKIKGLDENARVKLHIFSPGGDLLEGNEIYNVLNAHKGGVDVEIGALCASIATVIACAGDTVSIAENGLFMMHNPFTFAYGDADDFRASADILDKMKNIILDTYEKKSNKSRADLMAMMDETTWMDAEEAKEAGFVDTITKEDPDEEDIEDRFDLSRFKNSAIAISKLKKRKPVPEVAGQTKRGDAPSMLQALKANKQPTLVEAYMKGQLKIFNSIAPLTGAIYNNAAGTVDDGPVVDEAEIKKQAKALYEAKLKRDAAIDDIVLKVRQRDKKDFSNLAGKFKHEDKTAEEFAMAIATSDEFKPTPVIDGNGTDTLSDPSHIDVVGIAGIAKGSIGEQFVASDQYRALRDTMVQGHRAKGVNVMVKSTAMAMALARFFNATPTTNAGLTAIEKLPGVVGLAVRPLTVKDLIAPGATTSTVVRYIKETVFTNTTAPVAEATAKPEQVFAFAEVDAPVKKIASWTKMSEELYADHLAVASFINARMPYLVERVEEDEIMNGDGTGNHLTGILATAGIQTIAKPGTTPPPDADLIYQAMTKVRWANMASAQGGFEPDGIVIHPTNWQNIRLSKDTAGQYFGGGPFTGAYGNGGLIAFDTLWGKPVAVTPAIAAGTVLVGAFRLGAQYFQRQGVTIESTNTDQDDFIKNLMTIRAESRLALAVYRPVSFCTVTGI